MAQVIYAAEALADLERLAEFLLDQAPEPALAVLERVTNAIEILADHPLIGRRVEGELRELVILRGASGYLALYRLPREKCWSRGRVELKSKGSEVMEIEHAVARHYAHGSLEKTIMDALAAAGKDLTRLTPKDLAPVDEFHVGGRLATVAFAEQFGLRPGMRLLDVGCGLGGAARYFASEHGCQVTGIDLSGEYVAVANALAARVALGARVSCQQGSALELPFAPESFDGAYMFHVGMNIEDKSSLFREVKRILAPSGVFGIYDVMRLAPGDLHYPVPWTSSPEVSFVADAESYRRLLVAAGFEVVKERNRRDFALDVFGQMRARGAAGAPAPLGLHIVMGASAAQKVKNMIGDISSGLIAPTEMICRVAK